MGKSIGILDKDYVLWVKELVKRYRSSQIKAAIKVNKEILRYYWELGKDIEEKQADNKYGSKFYATLSRDLRHEMPDVEGLSETSIRYAKRFYVLYNQQIVNLPQVVEESEKANLPQLVERLYSDLFLGGITAISLINAQMIPTRLCSMSVKHWKMVGAEIYYSTYWVQICMNAAAKL